MPVDRPQRDGLLRRAAADFEVGQLDGARASAGQQVHRLVGAREQGFQQPRVRIDRSRLRHVEGRRRIAGAAGIDRTLPSRRAGADGEGLAGVARRRHAANRDRRRHPVGPGLAARVELEHLAPEVHALAPHARAVGGHPTPGVAVLAAGRLDDEMPGVGRRLRELGRRDPAPTPPMTQPP